MELPSETSCNQRVVRFVDAGFPHETNPDGTELDEDQRKILKAKTQEWHGQVEEILQSTKVEILQ